MIMVFCLELTDECRAVSEIDQNELADSYDGFCALEVEGA